MLFGYVDFSVVGDSYNRLYKKIFEDKLPCRNIKENNGALSFRTSIEYVKDIKELCKSLNLEYEINKRKGLFTLFYNFKKHIGIIDGAFLMIVICFVLSNVLLRVRILSDDSVVKKDIIGVLKENNAYTGSYIPNLNATQLERELKQKVDGISWAGISISGSTLTIDVVENINSPESNKKRLPSNLVAKRDAVVDKIEVLDGQLMTSVGSGVTKGATLVSGVITTEKTRYKDGKEVTDTYTRYVRSIGKIYGTFEETVNVFQPFDDKEKIISDKTKTKRYLKVFDAELPLFLTFPKGNYKCRATEKHFLLFGFELPVSIKKVKLNEISSENVKLSQKEAKSKAYSTVAKYEKNFYKDYKIKDKSIDEKIENDGVRLTVKYKLYGEICEENEFFIQK